MSHLALMLESFQKRTNPFIRFLFVGLVNTAAGLSITFFLLNLIGWPYWVSTFIGNSIGAIVSYFLNRTFTFHSSVDVKNAGPRFISVILHCYVGSYYASAFIASWLQQQPFMDGLILRDNFAVLLGAALYTVTNYFGQKHFVFRK
ncbi:GtrA family protein [Bacillus sp. T33-2]|uniref:GtrA family protein n=1 Tax=Bacillus sp. T33-2 TaxID=2054168 RepID=UPI000C77B277|nr:GtrA family protein [Bacillus sp. T33-2]PLR94164.1 polysaccharide biosynthesis protein GtrA [Bacillus sp. T33-2]